MICQLLIAAAAIAGAPSEPAAGGDDVARAELVARIERVHAAISSLRITTRMPDSAGPPGHYLHADILIRGRSSFALDFGHGAEGESWADSYWRNRTLMLGRRCTVEWPAKRAFERFELPPDLVPERLAVQPWFRASGYWPEGASLPAPKLSEVSISLLDAARDTRYRVGDSDVDVDGVACRVLEYPGVDRIYLARDRGLAVKARQWWRKDGRIGMTVHVREYADLGDGVHMPSSFEVRVYDGTVVAPGDGEPKLVFESEVLSIARNDVDATEFVYEPGPGALRIDRRLDTNFEQVVPGGLDYLISYADRFEARFAGQAGASHGPGSWWPWLIVLLVGLLACATAWLAGGRAAVRAHPRGNG